MTNNPLWRVWRYGASVALVVAATLLAFPLYSHLSLANTVMLFLAAVVVAALYLGYGPSFLAAVLSAISLDYFFVPPRLTLAIADAEYVLTLAGLMLVGVVIGALMTRLREQAQAAERHERQALEMYEFSRDLAAAVTLEDILACIVRHIQQTFGRALSVFLPEGEELRQSASSEGGVLTESEVALARAIFLRSQNSNQHAQVFPTATVRYLPLRTSNGIIGILAVRSAKTETGFTSEQERLLESFASQAALAVERVQLAERARRVQVMQATEKLQAALLNSISHDLRTPLVSITGFLSSLLEGTVELNGSTRTSLIENAYGEAQRLNHLVGNLLDMTRIEADTMKIKREECDVQDVIGTALQRAAGYLLCRPLQVDVPRTLPLVPLDFVLIVQVLVNLLDNACKYSEGDQPIEVQASIAETWLEIRVKDHGQGIPAQDLDRVFDKFYRVQRGAGAGKPGIGLGLAICRGIVEAHEGHIRAENREGGGTVMTLALPLRVDPEPVEAIS